MMTLALLSMALHQESNPIAFPSSLQRTTTPQETSHPMDGTYKVYWDDTLDGVAPNTARTVEPPAKTFDVRLKIRGGEVTGEITVRSVAEAHVTSVVGQVITTGNGANLLAFRELGMDYARAFQITLGLGKFDGVWHDTKGGAGDFRILKHQ